MNKNVGSSEQLEEDMAIWIPKHNADATADEPTKSILHTVLTVADYLPQDRPILLPLASKKFISAYTKLHTSTMSHVINLDVGDSTIQFTSK